MRLTKRLAACGHAGASVIRGVPVPNRNAGPATKIVKKASGPSAVLQGLWSSKAFRLVRSILRPQVVFALGILAIAVIVVSGYYYADLSSQIDIRLSSGALDN